MPKNSEQKESYKNDMTLYLVIFLLYVVLTHPATFTNVNKLLGTSWVSKDLSSSLDVKIIAVHGAVLCLLLFLFCKYVKPMLNSDD